MSGSLVLLAFGLLCWWLTWLEWRERPRNFMLSYVTFPLAIMLVPIGVLLVVMYAAGIMLP